MIKAKNSRIELRINPEDKKIIMKAAKTRGLSLSAYIISRILPSAKRELADSENFQLDNNDRDFFFNLLANPPAPNEALKKLMQSNS